MLKSRARVDQVNAIGKIPMLASIKEVREATATQSAEFPAYQTDPELRVGDVLEAVFGKSGPNRIAERDTNVNIGAHFDHYFRDFGPWAVHVNKAGSGVVRAAFLTKNRFEAYRQIAQDIHMDDPNVADLLASQRLAIATLQLYTSTAGRLEGELAEGTITLMHNGTVITDSAGEGVDLVLSRPSIHEYERVDGIGSYALYAFQKSGDYLPAGFTEI
ncbi:MAG: hypothetical protein ACXWLH_02825 [Candidatus Saccharimonadales bacterium]